MAIIYDILYGKIDIPDWLDPFIRIPEFVRLRNVRLSNVDCIQFKDLSSPTRWEHGIGAAWLALRCAKRMGLPPGKSHELVLAALLHDISTGPFAHTSEYVIENFDHEQETANVLSGEFASDATSVGSLFCSSLPRFVDECKQLATKKNILIDPEEVARMVIGDGEYGFLISGTVDLDNIDNVIRGCLYMGMDIDKKLPLRVVDWLSTHKECPQDLDSISNEPLKEWLNYRKEYYKAFFRADDQEIGRQAFLQHIMRRAIKAGLSKRSLIRNTDDALLSQIANISGDDGNRTTLQELVNRYRLIEPTTKFLHVAINSKEELRYLSSPQACRWIEQFLTTDELEPFVIVQKRRYVADTDDGLFPPPEGVLMAFKLGSFPRVNVLPEALKTALPKRIPRDKDLQYLSDAFEDMIPAFIKNKPWLDSSDNRKESIIYNLDNIGTWSFRLSRNESFHPYPSTFVHAIPTTFLNCLGIQGELVIDPFGGTGTTAIETIRLGGQAITSDASSIATIISKARLSYLTSIQRSWLKQISPNNILDASPIAVPKFDRIDKWHHKNTIKELTHILGFIGQQNDEVINNFLKSALSAVIPLTTGRRGKEHGHFADNTPLLKGVSEPPYQNAIELFISRVIKNVKLIDEFYATLEKNNRNPAEECLRAKVLNIDARKISSKECGIEAKSAAAIITSPPYLCMTDYTLGQRLSYAWLFPDTMQTDFSREIGKRRGRFSPEQAKNNYINDMSDFIESSRDLIRPGGFLCLILGAPEAQAFSDFDVIEKVFQIAKDFGYMPIWKNERPIYWHRQRYQRSKAETLAVFQLP